ncbi:MAG: (d)CMP kinase [Anaerovoracaceae bacterium]|nr:(d)CMP kinase [Anaerovoracaceae bacterium]
MKDIFKIAIDGPGGAGKSTVAKKVAARLGIEYIDTGAMYRAFGLKLLRSGVEIADSAKLRDMLEKTVIDFENGGVTLDGEDVSGLIRTPEISKAASACSAISAVREKMVKAQQKMGESKSVIMDGRDICEVVFPDAEYKYFLTASAEERANRRYKELREKGSDISYEQVLADIKTRDHNDSTRAASPMRKAEDAILLDTTSMTQDEVVEFICSRVRKDNI